MVVILIVVEQSIKWVITCCSMVLKEIQVFILDLTLNRRILHHHINHGQSPYQINYMWEHIME